MNTKERIVEAAIELFYEVPYGEVSLLQISKNAKVSNGIIYKYFKNKEELFKYLLEMISERVEKKLENISGESIEEKLKSYIYLNIEITQEERKLIKIFREGQYKFIDYEKRIKKAYLKKLEEIFERKLNEFEVMYILGSIRFINISYHSRNMKYDVDFLVKSLFNGFTDTCTRDLEKIYNSNLYKRIILNKDNLKHTFIEKGEEFFGSYEYHDVKIKDITKRVDCSIGMFYTYFQSKEEFLIEIVEKLKKEILFLIKDNYIEELDINELHIMYLYIFIEFYKSGSYKYKLLRNVEFINFDVYIDFLNKIERLYIDTLEKNGLSISENRIISNILLGVQHYMGIEIFFTEEIKDINKLLESMSYLFENGIKKLD
ncbi:TetR/AcrR family transcriptional regulator [Cetobacterium sp.]|uniref:TetR/AcrR family transcriptional regulator n=2 Tax=Cetobacterium sp. TaxID=2071632 RepID=UPI002FCC3E7D